jgi:hypothetical protein
MKPLSGMWLYINLAFAIVWDMVGFVLFIIGLIPAVQVIALVASIVVDVLAYLTDIAFCILYQGYVKIYNVNFKLYQFKRIREMMRLAKNSGASKNNPIAQNLARQTQKINQYMIDKFSNYVINFTVKKIQYSITTSVIELVPWLGDFSPTWTIKANLHLREHKATARELRIKNIEFENSLAKWRGSLRIGGVGKFKSRNNIPNIQSAPNKIKIPKNKSSSSRVKYLGSQANLKSDNIQSTSNNSSSNNIRYSQGQRDISQAANNIRPLRVGVSGVMSQSVQGQTDNNPDIMKTAANNIRPFRRKLPGEVGQSMSTQKENKLANDKSGVRKTAFMGGQLVYNFPQSLNTEDEELQYRKSVNKNIMSSKNKVLSDIASPQQSSKTSTDNNDIPANNIKEFTRTPQNQVNSERVLIKNKTILKR